MDNIAYRLRFFGGEHDGETYLLDKSRSTIIGRSPSSTIYIRDKHISRVHCQVTVTDEGCVITDLQSTNGTYLNGSKITSQPFNPGDEARIGITNFRLEAVESDGEEGQTSTAKL